MSIQFYNIVKILDFILCKIKKNLQALKKYNMIHLTLKDLQSSTISLVAFY